MPFERNNLQGSFEEIEILASSNDSVAKCLHPNRHWGIAACGRDPNHPNPTKKNGLKCELKQGEVVAIVKNEEPCIERFVAISFELCNAANGVMVLPEKADPHKCVIPPLTAGWFRRKPSLRSAKAQVNVEANAPIRNEVRVNALEFENREAMDHFAKRTRKPPKVRSHDDGAVTLEVHTVS